MKIATWNINGVKARLANLCQWLESSSPDIVCLQEIKSVDEGFPRAEIEALGYHVETHGQKGFNGVALLSKIRPDEVNRGLPGDEADEQARFIEGVFSVADGVLRVCSLYLPNGNPSDDPVKYPYKLAWMARLQRFAADRLALKNRLFWQVTIMSFRIRMIASTRRSGPRTRFSCRKPAPHSKRWKIWA